jgi:hypothetical protein
MSMPGFTASNSLGPSAYAYNGALSLRDSAPDAVVPEFLDFIKEAFESITGGFSDALQAAANALKNAIDKINSGGGGQPPFVCGQWATRFLACNGNSTRYSQGEMMAACIGSNPAQSIICAGITASMYSVLQQGCQQNPNGIGQLLGQICSAN